MIKLLYSVPAYVYEWIAVYSGPIFDTISQIV